MNVLRIFQRKVNSAQSSRTKIPFHSFVPASLMPDHKRRRKMVLLRSRWVNILVWRATLDKSIMSSLLQQCRRGSNPPSGASCTVSELFCDGLDAFGFPLAVERDLQRIAGFAGGEGKAIPEEQLVRHFANDAFVWKADVELNTLDICALTAFKIKFPCTN